MRASRVVAVVIGALGALIGLGFVGAGGAAIWAHSTQRDAAGFYTSPTDHLSTAGYAVTAEADFANEPTGRDWVLSHFVDTVRIEATSSTGAPVFIGIAPTTEVNLFLAGVGHADVTSLSFGPLTTHTREVPGTRPAGPPAAWGHWVASTSGSGTQSLTWDTRSGQWSAVVMNADASPGVAVAVKAAAKTGLLLPVGVGLGGFGVLLLLGASLLTVFGLRRPEQDHAEPGPARAAPSARVVSFAAAPTPYPARLDGHIDPAVSRWRWLVKWILVVPHVFVLVFLWLAVTVLTAVAGIVILFTGRYPRAIFDFNVGVMRWTWRVSFYALSAFGTDRYPPFRLASDPAYPADFDVDYPEHLSRGLVLVKWWLLALPHYLVVAVFAGGWGLGSDGAWRVAGAGGLVALLALIAAVILAATGRYPEQIFDFVMGMNRWCYRVLAYAALMRDEYPPFRFDTGGTDPGSMPVLPPSPSPVPDRTPELVGGG
ncbi:MAG TPA: DUF4389 domain-containing protein [Acidimicrobiales bacterium]|nr:DUF4389 domain-containing protein [Acidimicrobiales bacterium]